jgi:hypothetical protein
MNHRAAVFASVEGKRNIDDVGFRKIVSFDTVVLIAPGAAAGVRCFSREDPAAVAASEPIFPVRKQDELFVAAGGGGLLSG